MNVTAKTLFDYLYLHDTLLAPADLIVGFGHFDPKIPQRCCELYARGYAPRILFTGGVGAGTADIGMAEARYFCEEARRLYPDIPGDVFLIEPMSTHTGENVQYSIALLKRTRLFADVRSIILVANAYRQRRVWLTCRKQWPGVRLLNAPPVTMFEAERAMFVKKGQDLAALLVGEIERIVRYGALGHIEKATIPGRCNALSLI